MSTRDLLQIDSREVGSLLIIDNRGILSRLRCPFWVIALKDIDIFIKGDYALVEAISMDTEVDLVYIINEKRFKYFLFKIEEHH